MISALASPSVCVIDEDEKDYRPILDALNALFVSCVHIRGDSIEGLPSQPFKGLRLVFTDLHLTGSSGKDAASHTANIFRRVVHAETAPIVVVIWSKYADDPVNKDVPVEDQETEADLFKRTLLEAEGGYAGRLIFLEMRKPKRDERNDENWFGAIGEQIKRELEGKDAIDALLAWESLAKDAVLGVSEGITTLSRGEHADPNKTLENIKAALRLLTRAQGESDLSAATAPRHLATAMSQLLVDQLDHADGLGGIASHSNWLSSDDDGAQEAALKPDLNAFLLTMAVSGSVRSFMPGTVYDGIDEENFRSLFGVGIDELALKTCNQKPDSEKAGNWKNEVKPILVEVSPSCDVAQSERRNALLLAGVIVPSDLKKLANTGDAFQKLPEFALRWAMGDFQKQNVILVFCSRYKVTLPEATVPDYLKPWFRLRELPTASLRNWHASHASRVGYVSLA